MSHTVPANLGLFFGIRGRVVPTCSACTAGSQGIGYGYEAIRFGKQTVMVTGGAEELHALDAASVHAILGNADRPVEAEPPGADRLRRRAGKTQRQFCLKPVVVMRVL
jgi:3-oxoacyl-[acyl-carrier-protein] synthase II